MCQLLSLLGEKSRTLNGMYRRDDHSRGSRMESDLLSGCSNQVRPSGAASVDVTGNYAFMQPSIRPSGRVQSKKGF